MISCDDGWRVWIGVAALLALIVGNGSLGAQESGSEFRVERSTVFTSSGALHFAQSRAALIPGSAVSDKPPRVLLTKQQ